MARLLFCAPADPLDERAAWLWDLAESLRTREYEVVVAHSRGTFHDPMVVRQRYPHPITEQFDGSAGLREQRLLSLLALFQRVRPDIIVTVGLADALYAAAEWKRRGSQARVVAGIHEVEDEALVADLAFCQPFLDLVVATSRRMADRLKAALSMGAGRILHIPAHAAEPGKAARDRNKLENVGLFGQLEQKGRRVLDLVSLAQRLENEALRFHIGGRGPEESDLRARLKEEVGRGAFFFYGDLSKQERYENFYPRLDALLVLSERESGPMVLWEAMAHGIVPVVSDYVGRKEEGVIHQGKTGLVFPVGDMKAAAEKIRELKRGGKVESLSKNARQGLPAAYRQADFSRRWNEELQRLLHTELRTDPVAMLPRQVTPGWIARLGFSPEGTLRLRKLLRRRRIASNAAVEWPSSYGDKN